MNFRSEQIVSELMEAIEEKNFGDGLLIVSLPDNLDSTTINRVGEIISNAINALGKKNAVLLMPKGMKIEEISNEELQYVGLKKIKEPEKAVAHEVADNRQQVWTLKLPPMPEITWTTNGTWASGGVAPGAGISGVFGILS